MKTVRQRTEAISPSHVVVPVRRYPLQFNFRDSGIFLCQFFVSIAILILSFFLVIWCEFIMPWGHECRAKHIKQVSLKPTQRRLPISGQDLPGPAHYEPPEVFCGKGYSKIRRAPAYSFGLRTALPRKPAVSAKAPVLDVSGMSKKGKHRITHGVFTPFLEDPQFKLKVPGPNEYLPRLSMQVKRPPAYSMRLAAKPPKKSVDMWTPPPNMYCPPIDVQKKRFPAFSFGQNVQITSRDKKPGPGEYEPQFKAVLPEGPQYSFGYQFKAPTGTVTPAPNAYCEKKFNYPRPWIPVPSFGIKHSPYVGKSPEYLLTSPRGDLF